MAYPSVAKALETVVGKVLAGGAVATESVVVDGYRVILAAKGKGENDWRQHDRVAVRICIRIDENKASLDALEIGSLTETLMVRLEMELDSLFHAACVGMRLYINDIKGNVARHVTRRDGFLDSMWFVVRSPNARV
jgi:hypothetical protein